eukprot:8763744-Alexandrium_andersonii.AAC.1
MERMITTAHLQAQLPCLRSHAEIGVWIDQDFILRARDEPVCPIFATAAQSLRLWLVTCYHQAAVARLAARRPEFSGLAEVEVRALKAFGEKCCPRDKQM